MDSDRFHLDWARRQLADCRVCPRQCGVNRLRGEKGWCRAGAEVYWFLEYVGYGEEPELTPSHTLFLSHCSMDCLWCHTAPEQAALPHRLLTADSLRQIIAKGVGEGAMNLHFLGGEPSVNLPGLLLLLAELDCLPPLVWNSNSYCSAEVWEVLKDLIAVYAVDLKLFAAGCAARLTATPDYPEVAMARLTELYRSVPERILLRHLVLPGHFHCCTKPALEWIAAALPGVRVSLQEYILMPRARSDVRLGRFLQADEFAAAVSLATDLGIPLAVRLPGAAVAPATAVRRQLELGGVPALAQAIDIELVLSPEGRMFLRHPNRPAAELAAAILSSREEMGISQ